MSEPARVEAEHISGSVHSLWWLVALSVHTAIVYICAIHLSPWLVAHWFRWILPLLRLSTSTPATDWYLQHLEAITIVPALVVGYLSVRHKSSATVRNWIGAPIFNSAAVWACAVPTVVLSYKIFLYRVPSSVLYDGSISPIRYFFDIQKTMPTWSNLLADDPVRVLAQMMVTAPFYAGIAYTAGALASKHELLTKLFLSRHDEDPLSEESTAEDSRS